MMQVLEGRASVREKLGRFEEALEDGNRMLKFDKTNPKVIHIRKGRSCFDW